MDLGTLDKSESVDLFENDSSSVSGRVTLHQSSRFVVAEESILLGGTLRLFVGGNPRQGGWLGAGVVFGDAWTGEFDLAMAGLTARRDEAWRLESTDCSRDDCRTIVRDTGMVLNVKSLFKRLDFTFARRDGGPLVAFQLMDLPVADAPNGDEYTKTILTFAGGWHQPWAWGTLALFARATRYGPSWASSGAVQYTLDLGGDKPTSPVRP